MGHRTLIEGDSIRTGVTAIIPADGKLAGSTQVEELGTIETPIVLKNTLSVGAAMEGLIACTLGLPGNGSVRSVNALGGETNDGGLNDIRRMRVTRDDVLQAIQAARSGAVTEGSVGAGPGTIAFGWKGGIGTSSRRLPKELAAMLRGFWCRRILAASSPWGALRWAESWATIRISRKVTTARA